MTDGDYAGGGVTAAARAPAAALPAQGRAAADVLAEVRRSQQRDVDYRRGRNWAYTYYASEELLAVIGAAYQLGLSANGLSGAAFPSLARFEADILAWMTGLLGGHPGAAAGSLTSGGSESILLAVKTARDLGRWQGRPRDGRRANVVAARSTHPGFAKAAHYLGLELRRARLRDDQRADAADMAALIDSGTVLVVASAPSYPHGVVDDVPAIARLASEAGLPCHVDACVGGMVLPFARSIGAWHGEFDFAVPGVTSISADLHKYGYTAKGASVILYRTAELQRWQSFADDDWTGGRYEVPNLCGTRPGGAITAAWAVLRYLGHDGYCQLTRQSLQATARLRDGLARIDGLQVAGDPDINLIAVADARGRIRPIARELRRRGWVLGTQGDTSRGEDKTIHLTVTAGHLPYIAEFLHDLGEAAALADSRDGIGSES
jgi:sphinganine-1-phosphate aldolase